jgi:hypothetical protein
MLRETLRKTPMSIFHPKYKITSDFSPTGTVYRIYVRKHWFIFPYWSSLHGNGIARQDALMYMGALMKDSEELEEKYLRMM